MEMELQTFNATEHEEGDEMIAKRQTNGEVKKFVENIAKVVIYCRSVRFLLR
jgi:hypothetical protein